MLKIAITGGIASGKSLVLDFFKKKGMQTLSLDETVHKIYENDEFKNKLIEIFNTDKRNEIAKIVFKDIKKLELLENLIYPFILDEMLFFFKGKDIVFVEAPMLYKSGFDKYFDKIIFVVADEITKIERLKKYRNMGEEEAKLRIMAQSLNNNSKKKSDFIIRNNGKIEQLEKQCEDIFLRL
ncbi:MAG: dephospho-CoA kinase [Candidatus Gastranaerophilales bacterium]|nr:dephospho-CoA kinase [Candidatus Gastranaerophilales bacterium]